MLQKERTDAKLELAAAMQHFGGLQVQTRQHIELIRRLIENCKKVGAHDDALEAETTLENA